MRKTDGEREPEAYWLDQLGYGYIDGQRVDEPVVIIHAILARAQLAEAALGMRNAEVNALEARLKAATDALRDCSYFGHLSARSADNLLAMTIDRVLAGEDINVRETVDAQLRQWNEARRQALTEGP